MRTTSDLDLRAELDDAVRRQVMKATQGKANPAQVNELLKQKLKG